MSLKIKKYLPSTFVLVRVIIPAIGIIVFVVLNNYLKENKLEKKKDKIEILKENIDNEKNKDTDGDGLYDWQEELQGTDKNNPDTDGDGYSDGLEVKTESDPLDPLNTKKIKKEDIEKINFKTYDYRLDPNLNRTQRMAYEFLDLTMQLKRDGMARNKSAQEDIVQTMIENNSIEIDLMKFDKKDLNIDNDLDPEEVYNEWVKILEELKTEELMDETFLLTLYMKDGHQQKYLDMINENASVLKVYLERLKNLAIPVGVSKEYLDYLNAFNALIETNQYYSVADTDMVSVAQALGISKEIDSNFGFKLAKLNMKFHTLINNKKTNE